MKKYYKLLIAIAAIFVMLSVIGCDQLTDPGADPAADAGNYTVTFDSNGGSEVAEASVESGHKVTKPTDPTKSDWDTDPTDPTNPIETRYIFIGWYIDSDLTSRFDFNTEITEDKTLYAKWRPIARTQISFTPSGGSATDYEKTEEVYVITPDRTGDDITIIPGGLPSFIDEDADDMEKGVFWDDKGLNPFIMSRYEVTKELYKDVLTGVTFTPGSTGLTVIDASITPPTSNIISSGAACSFILEPSTCKDNPSVANNVYAIRENEDDDLRPVDGVTWYDAVYFCNQLTEKVGGDLTAAYTITDITFTVISSSNRTGHITNATVVSVANATGYRLPTEWEWEFAARGGDPNIAAWNYMFSGSDTASGKTYSSVQNSGLDNTGWYLFNTATANGNTALNVPSGTNRASWGSHETGKKAFNELGLFDMSGNVAEWCNNLPEYSVAIDPGLLSNDDFRVIRGGSWLSPKATECIVTHRELKSPDTKGANIGFRVVRKAPTD